MLTFIINIFQESISLWLAMAPYLLMGMFIAGIIHVFLGTDFIARHLGGSGFGSIFKATIFGIPLPICSCGVIPVAASLRNEGASRSSTLSFLVSTPTTGVDSILATYSLMGPLFAIFRPLAAFVSGIVIGGLNYVFNREETVKKVHSGKHAALPVQKKLGEVFRYGFLELAQDIGKWLVIGVFIGGVLTVLIPENFLLTYFSNPIYHFLIVLVIAVPLYVCATGSIPIAAALIQKGFAPGAALVFLIAGPATNAVTLSFVRSKLGKKAFYLYLTSIVLVSALAGWVFNIIFLKLGGDISLIHAHGTHLPVWLKVGSGIILIGLILSGFIKKKEENKNMKIEMNVNDMTCKHCKMTIENALNKIEGVDRIFVNIDNKTVGIDGDVSQDIIKKAIKDAGYTPEEKIK